MSTSFQQIITHRISLNILFWLSYFIYPFLRFRYTGEHTITLEEITFYIIFYGVILYGNNLYLLPKYLKSRKFTEYGLIIIPLILMAAFIESYVNKTLLKTCECEGPNSTYVIYNFIHLGSLLVMFGAVLIFRNYNASLRAYEKAENERLEAELKFLKSQVNPHLLFNSLNSIYAYALENSRQVPDMVVKLSEILRYMLYECDKPFVSLQSELHYLQDYIDLQKMRMDDIEVTFEVSGQIESLKIAPMILIAFVENAFKYTNRIGDKNARIDIYLSVNQKTIRFNIQNPLSPEASEQTGIPKESGGLGIKNARALLQISYPNRHTLELGREADLFFVDLKVDLGE